jgi:integrase
MQTLSKPMKLPGKKGYYVRVYSGGRRSWRSTGCTSYAAASEWRRTHETQIAMGRDRQDALRGQIMPFSEAVEAWLAAKSGTACDAHLANLRGRATRYWIPAFGTKPIGEITSEELAAYSRKRKSGAVGRLSRSLSATTINADLRQLSELFRHCIKAGWIDRNPMESVRRFSGPLKRRSAKHLSREDEEKLLRCCGEPATVEIIAKRNAGGPRGGKTTEQPSKFTQTAPVPGWLRPLVATAIGTGFRRRSLISLRWRNLNFQRREWHLEAGIVKTGEPYSAPAAESVVKMLREFRRQKAEKYGPGAVADDQLIFGIQDGSCVVRAFARAARRGGLQLTFHALRGVFLNRAREAGISLEATMALTGHKSVQTVLRHYRALPPEALRQATEALDRAQTTATENGVAHDSR